MGLTQRSELMKKVAHDESIAVWFSCPLCGNRFSAARIERHRNRRHPELSLAGLQAVIEEALRKRSLRYEIIGGTPFNGTSATQVLNELARTSTIGISSVVSGGAFGLGGESNPSVFVLAMPF